MVPEASRANANEGILTDVQGIQRKSSPLGEHRGRSLGDSGTSEVSKTSEDKQGEGVARRTQQEPGRRDGTFVIFVRGQADLWLIGILAPGKGKFAHLEPTTGETEVRFQSPVTPRPLRFPVLCPHCSLSFLFEH